MSPGAVDVSVFCLLIELKVWWCCEKFSKFCHWGLASLMPAVRLELAKTLAIIVPDSCLFKKA